VTDDEERELRIAVMQADLDLKRKQSFWEPLKALAAFAAGVAVFGGLVLAVANLWHPSPQNITVHLDAPLVVPAR
jgi:hypothetical protein